jgi:hypothetical protein
MEKSITVYCSKCNIRFKVIVEPDYSIEIIEKEFPDSKAALVKMQSKECHCPACGRGSRSRKVNS